MEKFNDENFQISTGRCAYFAEKNLLSGEIYNTYAEVARFSDNMCGQAGKYFEEK